MRPQKKRGCPRLHDGKVNFHDLCRWHSLVEVVEHLHGYTVWAHHQRLQRVVRVVLLLCDKVPYKPRYVLSFCSDEALEVQEVYCLYKARFQMELLLGQCAFGKLLLHTQDRANLSE